MTRENCLSKVKGVIEDIKDQKSRSRSIQRKRQLDNAIEFYEAIAYHLELPDKGEE